jgi:hypothetical protein
MPLKHLEHDGNEDFLESQQNRATHKIKNITLHKDDAEKKERLRKDLQEAWLDIDNPLLWDGEI